MQRAIEIENPTTDLTFDYLQIYRNAQLRKRDKMRGLPSILSLFCSTFNKFNNTRARILDSIYHMTLRLL